MLLVFSNSLKSPTKLILKGVVLEMTFSFSRVATSSCLKFSPSIKTNINYINIFFNDITKGPAWAFWA